MTSVTARAAWAPVNIALIKHWGYRDTTASIPARRSLSLTLEHGATTTVELGPDLEGDALFLDGTLIVPSQGQKAAASYALVGEVRRAAGLDGWGARIVSESEVPISTGMASSAAGGAALTLALLDAGGLLSRATPEEVLSWCARTGSFSALRSLRGGAVRLDVTQEGIEVQQVAVAEELAVVSVQVASAPKQVSSSVGHARACTSPFREAFEQGCAGALREVERALEEGVLSRLGPVVEAEALAMHAVMLSSSPPIVYGTDATWSVWRRVAALRAEGLEAFGTLDAGPNPHVLCRASDASEVRRLLGEMAEVERTWQSLVSPCGARSLAPGPSGPLRRR